MFLLDHHNLNGRVYLAIIIVLAEWHPFLLARFFHSDSSSYFHYADELISRGALIVIGQE